MSDRLTEIKARVAEYRKSASPQLLVSDLEFTLGVIADQDKQIESLQNKWATRPLDHPSGEALMAENDRLRAALQKLVHYTDGQVAGHTYQGELFSAKLCRQYADEAHAALEESK